MNSINRLHFSFLSIALLTIILLNGCQPTDNASEKNEVSVQAQKENVFRPVVSSEGERIVFAEADPSRGVLKLGVAEYKDVSIITTSPARIVLTTVAALGGKQAVPVFETTDLTQLYT